MRVRKQDSSGDMVFGGSQRAFWIDQSEAVGQVISTRLMLYQGEWFLDTSDGTPWNTQVLGKYTNSTRDPVIQARVLGTPDVKTISNYNSQVLTPTRTFNAAMSVSTSFGPVTISAELPSTGVLKPPTATTVQRQFITVGGTPGTPPTPSSVLISWSTVPVFTLDDPVVGVMDSGNLLG